MNSIVVVVVVVVSLSVVGSGLGSVCCPCL